MFKKKPSPDTVTPEPEGAAPRSRLRRKLVTILGLTLLSAAALGGGLVAALGPSKFFQILGGNEGEAVTDAQQKEGVTPSPPGADMVVMPFDEMIVNIAATAPSGRQTSRFLKLDLALVYDRTQDADGLVEARHVYLRDAFQDYLRQLTDRDLEGTLGLMTVKSELLRRARAIAGSDAPNELLVLGLVMQ